MKLSGPGGLLALTKMVIEGPWKASWMITSGMASISRKAAMAVIPVWPAGQDGAHRYGAGGDFGAAGTGIPVSSRKSSPNGSGGWPASMR